MNEFERRTIYDRDTAIFNKAIKLYFFVKHIDHSQIHPDLQERFAHCSNVVYSMLRAYLEKGIFQIEYLDFLNDEIKSWTEANPELFKDFTIMPEEIDEIELSAKVPIQFQDSETGERMRLVFYPDEKVCDYSVFNVN